jgi:hypothetical protein
MIAPFSTKCHLLRKLMSLGLQNIFIFQKTGNQFKRPLRKIRQAGTYSWSLANTNNHTATGTNLHGNKN